MKQLIYPIAVNESSSRVQLLHTALAALGMPVSESERASKTAGDSTIKAVRSLQSRLNVPVDEQAVLDATTAAAIERELKVRGILTDDDQFSASGRVITPNGTGVGMATLVAFDIDLKGAAYYQKAVSLEEVMKKDGFELLGNMTADRDGYYRFTFSPDQFKNAERKKADLVVYAIKERTIIGRSRLISSEDYSDTGEVRNLDVMIKSRDKRTEYEALMTLLAGFLNESDVTLQELANSNDQMVFTAGELNVHVNKIAYAAFAQKLMTDNKLDISHEMLYALGRNNYVLILPAFHNKKAEDLKMAILVSTKQRIIREFSEKEIDAFIQALLKASAPTVLNFKPTNGKASLGEVLSSALPERKQQEAFLEAVNSFNGSDYREFWNKFLSSRPEFKDKPELVKGLLQIRQLSLLSGNHLPMVNELQKKNKQNDTSELLKMSDKEWEKTIKKTGVPDGTAGKDEEEKIKNYSRQIQNLLNASYPTQRIKIMLDNGDLPFEDSNAGNSVKKFLAQTPSFDFAKSRVHDFDKELKSSGVKDVDALKNNLCKVQRVFQVSTTPEVMTVLMKDNLDSAHAIAAIPQKSFVKMYSGPMGSETMAYSVHERASYISSRSEMIAMTINDISMANPQLVMGDTDLSLALTALQNQVPNYSELFGSPDICECEHCRSVYGAAAYFVDLLRFLWRGVKNHDNKSPLDMLLQRRPDLVYLPLTCENTDTVIPYIDIVNEVMEFYVDKGSLTTFKGFDTGEITPEELRADPQNFNLEAYRKLKDAKYPFNLPYHQALDVIRTYGEHLKTARYEAMEAMQTDFTQTPQRAIDAEALKISPEEYTILCKESFAAAADATQLHVFFGYTNAGQMELMAGVKEFLRRSGIKYTDLVELVKTKFINPNQVVYDFLQDIFKNSTLDADQLYTRFGQINAGTLQPSADAAIMVSLNVAGITSNDFATWMQGNFANFNSVITLYEPNSQCSLDTTVLRILGNVYAKVNASEITSDTWSRIHRFIRLWKKLGWTIHELDLVLMALDETDIRPMTITKLSGVMRLNRQLKWPLNQLASLWGSIDTYGDKSLYKKLFLNKTISNLDTAFEADEWGNYLDDNTVLLGDHLPAILAAFRLSQEDLDAILGVTTVIDAGTGNPRLLDPATDKLNLPNLSTIYRYAVLSKALKFKVPDFCLLLQLFNAAPFSTWDNQMNKYQGISPELTLEFYDLAGDTKKAGFKPAVLQYIINGQLVPDATFGLNEDKARQTAKTIRETFATIEQDHPEVPTVPLTTDILRSKLSLTYQTEIVSQMIAIIDGSASFSTVTVANLLVVIPANLATKYSYIKASGRLTCNGIMSDAEKTTIRNLDVNGTYKADVDSLYTAPEDFLTQNFSGVFVANMATAFATLLDHPAQVPAATLEEKLQLVYDSYLPLLKQKLREDAITQHIAALTRLSEEAAKILTQADVNNLITDLAQEGHSAEYFNDLVWGALALSRTDATIDFFDWQAGSPDAAVAANNFTARWQSYIVPPASGDYTLIVEVSEADEAFKLYIDDALVLEKVAGNAILSWEVIASLNASQMHKLKVEYAETMGNAGFSLSWKTATTAAEILPASSAYPAAIIDSFVNTVTTYYRAAKFITGFELNEVELDHLVTYKADFANIDFRVLIPDHWKRINEYTKLRDAIPQAQATLIDVFKLANATSPAPVVNTLRDLLAQATAWDPIVLDYFVNTHYTLAVADFKNEIALSRLYDAVVITNRTGISADTIAEWGKVEISFDALYATAQLIKGSVKAKYEEKDWLDVAGKLSDKIRENQKQSLISYLLMKPELQAWGAEDADGLFEYFLIDVQMGSCMETSRIVQANAAVQMFVNRSLLNLESEMSIGNEKGVSPSFIDADRWEWMKNYRVWEANRKVFCYPENWLEPEWRDDRSPFFKDLESELMQNDISTRSVEAAFRSYLAKLNEVAHLEIVGMFQENDEQTGKLKLLHVFGRTNNAPYKTYYRTWDEYMKWSAWEKVEADIRNIEEGNNSGVHVLPVIWKQRLFLFWPEFVRKEETPKGQNSSENKTAKKSSEEDTMGSQKSIPYWEVRLGWTEYVDDKWTPKQLSKEFLKQYIGQVVPTASVIRLLYQIDSDNQLLLTTNCRFDEGWVKLGTFTLADITSKIETTSGNGTGVGDEWGYSFFYEKLRKTAKLTLLDDDYLKRVVDHRLLLSPLRVRNDKPTLKDPFFYNDSQRHYFVRPVNIRVSRKIQEPEVNYPDFGSIVDDSYYTGPKVPHVEPDDILPVDFGWDPVENLQYETIINSGEEMTLGESFNDGVLANVGAAGGNTMMVRRMMMAPAAPAQPAAGAVAQPMMASSSQPMMMAGSGTTANSYKTSYATEAFGGIYVKDYGKVKWGYTDDKGLEFHTFYHPYSTQYVTNLNRDGIDGLMLSDTTLPSDEGSLFVNKYDPNFTFGFVQKPSDFAKRTYFKENVCFDVYGANSLYNWELFFHAPLYIATRLSRNGQYEEAMKWFHYIFDPTTDDMPGVGESEVSRYWKVKPFKTTIPQTLEELFLTFGPNNNPANENSTIGEWRDNPFSPHSVARNRPIAYMKHVVIKYVENLLEWGDTLFRQFTRESVNESLQIYVMANHILGPRPEFVPKRGDVKAESYDTLKDKLDDFSNAVVQLENIFPYSSDVPTGSESTGSNLLGLGETFYFCIPNNDKLMEYWDRAADRLYKIRHCMDIDGVERKLALFAPPIDPAALIQAASMGLSLGSILADLSSPPPIYRFSFLVQKANEFCMEVKSLGNALLTALEKKDTEEIARLRATQEVNMNEMITGVKERQILEARSNRENLEKSRALAQFRLSHYNSTMLGNENITVPDVPTVPATLTADSSLPADTTISTIASDADGSLVDSGESGIKIIPTEQNEILLGLIGQITQGIATGIEAIGGMMNFIPNFSAQIEPFGCGVSISYGGSNIAGGMSGIAKIPQGIAAVLNYMAAQSGKIAGYIRREQDWTLQANLAAKEIAQIDKQIVAAAIRIQIAEKELENHKQQIENSKQVKQFLENKFTNQELYQWMKEQLFAVYKQTYNMSYDMAKKAEKAYKYEIGNELASFIQFGYWENSRQGLLSGEKLQLALHQMEKSYIGENKRELELRKNVSLAMVNPLALQELRQTGKCYISLPEELFDMDFQGHYFRRLKTVSLTIPCIAGPLTTISCTLRLLKNTVRINTSMNENGTYEHMNDEGAWIDDDRFRSSNVPVQSIAVSNAQADAGLFELNFRDERYLPFEGAGAVSDWKIELTTDVELRQFDYTTISDVILHLSYTAREDAGLFKESAVTFLKSFLTNVADLSEQPLMRMFSMRHEFPTEWYRFLNPTVAGTDQVMKITLKREHFPFFTKDRDILPMEIDVFASTNRSGDYHMIMTAIDTGAVLMTSNQISMPENPTYGDMQKATITGAGTNIVVEDMDVFAEMSMKLKHNTDANYHSIDTSPEEIEDLFVVIHYKLG